MLYTSFVSFIPLDSNLNVTPIIVSGRSDSTWVRTKKKSKEAIHKAAKEKMLKGYGVRIKIEWYTVEWRSK